MRDSYQPYSVIEFDSMLNKDKKRRIVKLKKSIPFPFLQRRQTTAPQSILSSSDINVVVARI